MAAAAILDCRIHKISLADSGWMAQTHHFTKFPKLVIPLRRCSNFSYFQKMAAAAILDFRNHKMLLVIGVQRVETHQYAKFRLVAKILRFFDFSRWRPSAILDLFGAYLDHQQWVFGGLYQSAKFGYAVVFIIWTFQYLARLARKCLSCPQNCFFGQFDP